MKHIIIMLILLVSLYSGCRESSTGPEYTVIDEIFYQKDYDSLHNPGINIIDIYIHLKIKKIKINFEFYTNRPDSNYIALKGGHYPNYWVDTIHNPGIYTIQHEFPITQDSTIEKVYSLHPLAVNSYIIVRNFKAYRSY